VRIYHTTLPHWRQTGATYFVTFRLADSIPRHVVAQWDEERRVWLKARGIEMDGMGEWPTAFEKLSEADQRSFERENARKLFRCLDECHGACVLRQPGLAMIVRDALLFFDKQRYELGDFVVMPNHVHLLIAPRAEWELEALMQSLKRYCARQINSALKRKDTSLWQKGFYDHIVRDEAELRRCGEYIRLNPEKARLRSEFLLRSADL
jgi:type I restriction enzyme R subunit